MKITVAMPAEVVRKPDILAKRFGMSRSRLIEVAVQEFAGSRPESELVRALDAVLPETDGNDLEFLRRAARETLKRSEW